MTLDDLELELRKLPGVRAAGFSERDEVLLVQLHVGDATDVGLPLQATRIAHRHSERPVAVELVRWRTAQLTTPPGPIPQTADDAEGTDAGPRADVRPADEPAGAARSGDRRVRLLAVLTFPDTDELEVHLTLEGRRTIGRAAASRGLVGAVEATVDALRAFTPSLALAPGWAKPIDVTPGEPFLVACEVTSSEGASRHGIATGSSPIEAAARASLHALNRTLARMLEPAPAPSA